MRQNPFRNLNFIRFTPLCTFPAVCRPIPKLKISLKPMLVTNEWIRSLELQSLHFCPSKLLRWSVNSAISTFGWISSSKQFFVTLNPSTLFSPNFCQCCFSSQGSVIWGIADGFPMILQWNMHENVQEFPIPSQINGRVGIWEENWPQTDFLSIRPRKDSFDVKHDVKHDVTTIITFG